MGEVINLNRFRKARGKVEAEKKAEENRVSFGRSKAERRQETLERDRTDQDLDDKKLT